MNAVSWVNNIAAIFSAFITRFRDCQGGRMKKTMGRLFCKGIRNVDMIHASVVVFKPFAFSVL